MARIIWLWPIILLACDDGGSGQDTGGSLPDAGRYDGGRPQPIDAGPPLCVAASGPCEASGCLRINEVLAKNDGVWLDEELETEDYLELFNAGAEALELNDYFVGDRADDLQRLPPRRLESGEHQLLWLDKELDEGSWHLPFKVSASGDQVWLWHLRDGLVDCLDTPALAANEVLARYPDGSGEAQRCAYATPAAANTEQCGQPPPSEVVPSHNFAPYHPPDRWPAPDVAVVLNEAGLHDHPPWVEVWGSQATNLSGFLVDVAPNWPGAGSPQLDRARAVTLGATIAAGEAYRVELSELAAALVQDPNFEGVITLYDAEGGLLDRVDFMVWPEGSSLARWQDGAGPWRLCVGTSAQARNGACEPLAARPLVDRAHRILTPSDYTALAEGGTGLGMEAVKFIVDRSAGGVVHLLSGRAWDLHYTFVRERIDGEAHLNRCEPDERAIFRAGWGAFSQREYFETEGRRFYLGTLLRYAANDLRSAEFVTGDRILVEQLREAVGLVSSLLPALDRPAFRPQGPTQFQKALELEGSISIVAENAPFVGMLEQPLNAAIGFGVLRFVAATELDAAVLGQQVLLVTDQVPNDVPLVGGLITEAFQTPLAHVNLLARNRGTPNMALRGARTDQRLASLWDRLVRLEVHPGGFSIRAAQVAEAEAYWLAQRPDGDPLIPALDLSVRGIQPLSAHGILSTPSIGAKAAQLAQLAHLQLTRSTCPGAINTPAGAFAVPLVHGIEHFAQSGAAARLIELLEDPEFRSDPQRRAVGLAQLRTLIIEQPVEASLLAALSAAIESRYGDARTRLRSSSNTEDLPGFSGAGLYTSVSVEVGDPGRSVADGLRRVWASLWSPRAFDERTWFGVDQTRVAMAALVHPAYRSEKANGVAISRNVLDPIRGDVYYLNVQAGEATVTNPAPGVGAESLLFRFGRSPEVVYQSRSSLTAGAPVLQTVEVRKAICTLAGIHSAFRPMLDPDGENRWFAMDIEFKLIGADRRLLVKQARPFSFGRREASADCREF